MSDKSYTFVDEAMAWEAFNLAKPTIVALLATWAKRQDLYVVIGLRGADRKGIALIEESFGNAGPYRGIAGGKFHISARTGLSSRLVQAMHPSLLGEGDTKYGGSVVIDEIVVAASGVESHFDETIAGVVAVILQGLCHHVLAKQREEEATDFFTS